MSNFIEDDDYINYKLGQPSKFLGGGRSPLKATPGSYVNVAVYVHYEG